MNVRPLHIVERKATTFPAAEFPAALAEELRRRYGNKLELTQTSEGWQVKPSSWVGILPCGALGALHVQPKVGIRNLFRMLEWAWDFKYFELFTNEPLAELASLEDVFERLAIVLAQRTLARVHQGLYRAYLPHAEPLPYLRGRLDLRAHLRSPETPRFPCSYEELSADIEDNRILAWTLRKLARSGLLREDRALLKVRAAFEAIGPWVTHTPVSAADCTGRSYHRLNQDYEPLHALCRFFLECTGPQLADGDHGMLPFLVETETLFEQFVPRWLRGRLGARWHVAEQESRFVPGLPGSAIFPDVVLYRDGRPVVVLDTKYKAGRLVRDDVYQIHTYAAQLGAPAAFLIFPTATVPALDAVIGQLAPVRVRALGFDLSGDLESAGTSMLDELLATIAQSSPGSSSNTAS